MAKDGKPIPAAWCKGVAPNSLEAAGSAPQSSRNLAVAKCPCRVAWIRGVSPVKKQPIEHYK